VCTDYMQDEGKSREEKSLQGEWKKENVGPRSSATGFLLRQVFIKSFRKSQFPHRFDNLSFLIAEMKNKLTNLCGN